MDTMKSQKLKAKKKKKERDCLFQNILLHLLTTLTCALLGSYLFWLPSPFSAPESFVLVSFLQWKPVLANAKTLFLVANLIAIFLMGDYGFRRASKGPSSSPVDNLYDEYVERSKRLWVTRVQGTEEREEKDEGQAPEVQLEPAKDEGEQISNTGDEFEELPMAEPAKSAVDDMQDSKLDEGSESNKSATEEPMRSDMHEPSAPKSDKSGESDELPWEELTRRVDEFIARVNKRRLLESRSQ
ncbi:hypothetical protein MLD38_008494 [Melastoma candidum]|uniref:Uncharacterized protein n=1 Tax=Melastoma candidum TaxID=119954 RepID=A0ACB9RWD5_9MYRT|nr:hypothetical protein MLD38_008494 [Melastoma candidum]